MSWLEESWLEVSRNRMHDMPETFFSLAIAVEKGASRLDGRGRPRLQPGYFSANCPLMAEGHIELCPHRGFVIAPSEAEWTRAAYLANTPEGYFSLGDFHPAIRCLKVASFNSTSSFRWLMSM